ncbi:MAG: hypothetical protein J6X03_04510 [Bacilli bacterium]|nr:hypothetical protein [Bacilli bacterium]
MSKLFKTDKSIVLVYFIISLISLGLSCFSLFADNQFNYYPIVITAISFVFGFIYLMFLLQSSKKQIDQTKNPQPSVASFMALNLLRFLIVAASIGVSVIFIYFGPRTGEVEKRVYLLILINGAPLLIDIFLFYMRGRYND